MNRIQKLSLSIFSAALLAAAVAVPSHAVQKSQMPPAAGAQQQLQSVSGKITSVAGKTFTLSTSGAASSPSGAEHFGNQAAAQSMTFTIDDNTTVSGKLAVGSNADVTYRSEGGQNIAVSVRVSS